jgi:hypothetical protein
LAVSLLPVGRETLIYGSCDSGATVHAKDEDFNNLMKSAAKTLNLRRHLVGKPPKSNFLFAAVRIFRVLNSVLREI